MRQYIGARYVPIISEPYQWDINTPYENLVIVYNNHASYISKKPVPVGIQISNTEYWALSGNYNGQVESYRQETERVKNLLESLKNDTNRKITDLTNKVDTDLNNLKSEFNTNSENLKKFVDKKVKEQNIVIIGDSYGDKSNSYVERCKVFWENSKRGKLYNCCKGGCGFGNDDPYNYLNAIRENEDKIPDKKEIDRIIIAGGHNDMGHEMSKIMTGIDTIVNYLKIEYPNAKMSYAHVAASHNFDDQLFLSQSLLQNACGLKGLPYISQLSYVLRNTTFVETDGIHPNSNGDLWLSLALFSYLCGGNRKVLYEVPIGNNATPENPYTTDYQGNFIKCGFIRREWTTSIQFEHSTFTVSRETKCDGSETFTIANLLNSVYRGCFSYLQWFSIPVIIYHNNAFSNGILSICVNGTKLYGKLFDFNSQAPKSNFQITILPSTIVLQD